MNILHLSTEYNLGGSGRAAYRIHSSLLRRGHTSRMLVSGLVHGVPEAGALPLVLQPSSNPTTQRATGSESELPSRR